jgi:protein TonB
MVRGRRQRLVRRAPIAGGALFVALMVGALVWMIHSFMVNKQQQPQRNVIQQITLVRPPPPPPEPPPPTPEKVEQATEQKQPEPTPDNTPTPPQQQLGLDASGTAGSDSFGLVARPGGSDLVGTGGAAFAWYTGKLRDAVSDRLASDPKLHAKKFTVSVRIWIASDGQIKQVNLAGGSGSRDIDGEIAQVLDSLGRLDEAPPLEMPQPVTLQIVGRT